ncbi:MAG TPA: GNAT family N-acetyltransferase [Jiangellaceae bacterium]|nr:GNAT family N-acetyltransferase [Jiangellaceae bacterium]
MTRNLPMRAATDADMPALVEFVTGVFLRDVEDDELDVQRLITEPDRTHVITDGAAVVGTGMILTRDLTVPGAVIPAAHVTGVAVASTHRRQGLLTRIMTAQLEAVRDRGTEPVAVLWASEGAIYGRFGYGVASWQLEYTIATRDTALAVPAPPGRLRQAVPKDVIGELSAVFDRVQADRPGRSGRDERWWKHLTADPRSWRRGRSAQRAVLYDSGTEVEGYALWRVKSDWSNTGPDGQVAVIEVVVSTADAYQALWSFLLSIDLTRTVTYHFAAPDEPLAQLVTNPSGLDASMGPGLWVRIVDLPRALAERRYTAPVDVVLDVTDSMLPANTGRWRLVGDDSAARCDATDDEPDLTLDVRHLGAAYLGGTSLLSLGAAGLVTENRAGTIGPTSTAFSWSPAPLSIEIF